MEDFVSEAPKIADYVNKNDHIVIDVGQITLDETATMTADGQWVRPPHSTASNWAN